MPPVEFWLVSDAQTHQRAMGWDEAAVTEHHAGWIALSAHIYCTLYKEKNLCPGWNVYKSMCWCEVLKLKFILASPQSYILDSYHNPTKRALVMDWCDPNQNHITPRMSPKTTTRYFYLFLDMNAHTYRRCSCGRNPLQAFLRTEIDHWTFHLLGMR